VPDGELEGAARSREEAQQSGSGRTGAWPPVALGPSPVPRTPCTLLTDAIQMMVASSMTDYILGHHGVSSIPSFVRHPPAASLRGGGRGDLPVTIFSFFGNELRELNKNG
jgi:hypothetical protein